MLGRTCCGSGGSVCGSIAQAEKEEGTAAAKVVAISVGVLIAILMLLVIAFVAVAARLRKIGKEDQIPEAIRATSAYTTLFPGMEDDDSPFSPSNSSSNPVADPSSIEMRVKDGPGTEL